LRISISLSGTLRKNFQKGRVKDERNSISRPWDGWKTFQDIFREVFRGEVAILQQSTGLYLDIANWPKFFNQGSKRMEGADGLYDKG
jgi:hypothetical protein